MRWRVAVVAAVCVVTAASGALSGCASSTARQSGAETGSTTGQTDERTARSVQSMGPAATAETTATTAATPAPTTPAAPLTVRALLEPPALVGGQAPTASPADPGGPPGPTAVGPLLGAAEPASLSIPAIGVMSPLIQLGLNQDSTIQVPSLDDPESKAGWFRNSPEPGTLGPAIILGHVDSRRFGPGVFYSLGALQPGDPIEIARADGSVAVFGVDGVRNYDKDAFPTLEVYGNIDHAGLRLITCGGIFDSAAGSYEQNIVVFASLRSSR